MPAATHDVNSPALHKESPAVAYQNHKCGIVGSVGKGQAESDGKRHRGAGGEQRPVRRQAAVRRQDSLGLRRPASRIRCCMLH